MRAQPHLAHVLTLAAWIGLTACQPLAGPLTPAGLTDTPAPPTPYPQVQCTPPACWSREHYFCPGDCPGGCGTTCATAAPGPATPVLPAAETICALPTPAAAGTPALRACAAAVTVPVSGTLQVLAEVTGMDAGEYVVEGEDQAGGRFSVRVKSDNQYQSLNDYSTVVRFAQVQAGGQQMLLTLTAHTAGQITFKLFAFGHLDSFARVDAEPLTVTVTQP